MIDYERLERILTRCAAIAAMPDVDASVKRVYDEKLAGPAATFLTTHKALVNAETKAKKEGAEALAALEAIDQPYRKARAVAQEYVVDLALPETLKSLSTDTDKSNAIKDLLGILDEHDDAPGWAAELTDATKPGSFGALAPTTIREIDEGVGANAGVEKAQRDRAAAYGPAYERYLGFKNVVRNTYGSKSMHYRRIHIRKNGRLLVEEDPVTGG